MLSYSRNQEVGSVGVGAGLYMYDVVVKKFTFAISSDEFVSIVASLPHLILPINIAFHMLNVLMFYLLDACYHR